MNILGIESSCDETAVAIYSNMHGLRAHVLFSQIPLHQLYGGVVPELASRDHIKRIVPLTQAALSQAGCELADIDAVAYTAGPGLMGALMVGATFGAALAYALDKPTLPVHHLEAHLLAPFLEPEPPSYPFVALLVSGGHTLLAAVERFGQYQILGETKDDAAGEAFDKTAKMLGLPYPGGPELARLASDGVAKRFHFPRPMVQSPDLMFSFSGLKTAAYQTWLASDQLDQTKADIAHEFQEAVVETLVKKSAKAIAQTQFKNFVIAGGVSANVRLRVSLHEYFDPLDVKIYYPRLEFCTDNAAMVAYAGYLRYQAGERGTLAIEPFSRRPLPG
jgi:N6-L-threonylcarbamoyladenine synthase